MDVFRIGRELGTRSIGTGLVLGGLFTQNVKVWGPSEIQICQEVISYHSGIGTLI